MPENTTQPFRGFFSAMEAMKKIDAICGEDWGGDEEIFRTNSDLQDLYATYKEGMREYRRGIGPDLVLGGNNKVLTDIMREMRGFREVEGGAKEYIRFSKDVFKILGHEDGVDIFDNLLSMKCFLPDDWLDRISKDEMGPLLVKGAGISDWLHKRYTEAAYASVYGFFNASVAEGEKIRHLLQRKVRATRSEQKVIRASTRRLGFYISDFTSSAEGFTASDFDDLVERGEITIAEGPRQESSRTLLKSPNRIPITINKMKQQEKCVPLPDVLETGMKVVFCGTAVGDQSALRGAYYAGPGNQFWNILADTGLTPHRFAPEQYLSLLKFKIGLTDLVKGRSGQDVQLSAGDFDVSGFRAKIEKHAPKAVAFNGKKAAQLFFASPSAEYGPQKEKIGPTALFVLPSTSGAARGFLDPKFWFQLADFVSR